MSTAILQPPSDTGLPPRKRFTRAEVDQMMDAGLLLGQRLELIDGDLIDKMGQNPPHSRAIRLVVSRLARIFAVERILVQAPIEVASADQKFNYPEPDIAVLAEDRPDYGQRHAVGDELLLVVEVADTTVWHDATTKRDLYARAGVPEYWVLDLNGRRLIVHRNLAGGRYEHIETLSDKDSISLVARPEESIEVGALIP